MNAKQLAEFMLDEELYKPEADAHSIAKSYLELAGLVEKVFEDYNKTGRIGSKLCLEITAHLDHDPART